MEGPSQSGNGNHIVNLDHSEPFCTCPDFETRHCTCKHIYAVEYVIQRESHPDGTTVVTKAVRITYSQDWPAYNVAQTHEAERFAELLGGLCQGIPQPPQTLGRPRLPLPDVVFAAIFKVYSTMSGRRAMVDLKECQTKGFIDKAPHYLMTGIKTHVVTSVEVTPTEAADAPQFSPLVNKTAQTFAINEVFADKAYSSKRNLQAVAAVGGTPYIPFKSYSTGVQGHHKQDSLWDRLWHFYSFNRAVFLEHYHKRSNAESTLSMIKGKFGASVRSKSPVAQVNEVFCKVLCHNICVLIQSIYELGLEPTFGNP